MMGAMITGPKDGDSWRKNRVQVLTSRDGWRKEAKGKPGRMNGEAHRS